MSVAKQIAYKNRLKQFCQSLIEERIAAAKKAMAAAQEAANAAEKSSAGDKYETARAMGHLEKDMHAKQLGSYIKELSALSAAPTGAVYATIQNGTFIKTSKGNFFIAAGLGKQLVDGTAIYFLSAAAPLAQQLMNKKEGATFCLNNALVTIIAIY